MAPESSRYSPTVSIFTGLRGAASGDRLGLYAFIVFSQATRLSVQLKLLLLLFTSLLVVTLPFISISNMSRLMCEINTFIHTAFCHNICQLASECHTLCRPEVVPFLPQTRTNHIQHGRLASGRNVLLLCKAENTGDPSIETYDACIRTCACEPSGLSKLANLATVNPAAEPFSTAFSLLVFSLSSPPSPVLRLPPCQHQQP